MTQHPFISIVVPVWNEERYITQFLECVLGSTYPRERMELLLVDGRSRDGTRGIIEDYCRKHSWIRLLENPKRTIPPALNIGLKEARGEIIVRMDVHTCYPLDYIAENVRVLLSTGAQNVGGRVVAIGDNYIGSCIALATSHPFGVGDAKWRYSEKEEFVETVYLGTWKTATLRQLGGFDESLEANEDYELNYRLRKAGGRVLIHPAIQSQYYVRPNLGALGRQYVRYGFWKVRALRLHPDSLRWRQVMPPLLLLGLLASAGLGICWPGWGLVLPGVYVTANVAASLLISARHGWRYLAGLPLVFGMIHLGWGAGFVAGLFSLLVPRRRS